MSADRYQKALREYVAARAHLGAMADALARVSGSLSQWRTALPKSVNGTLERSLIELPDRSSLDVAIVDWKDAHLRVTVAWEALSEDDRIGLLSPEQFQPDDVK